MFRPCLRAKVWLVASTDCSNNDDDDNVDANNDNDDADEHDDVDHNCHNSTNLQARRSRFCMVIDLHNTLRRILTIMMMMKMMIIV